MGCGLSTESEPAEKHELRSRRPKRKGQGQGRLRISFPIDRPVQIPHPRTDERGARLPPTSYDIDRSTLEAGLTQMAAFLNARRAQFTVIAVGGAISALSKLDNPARILLDEAMEYAINHVPAALGSDWFNTETQLWLSRSLHEELTNEAIEQDVVIFSKPGLRMLAAPWNYAFSGKVERLLKDGERVKPYDLTDAVHDLQQIVDNNNGQPVDVDTVASWAQRFGHKTSEKFLLSTVNEEYKRLYGHDRM